MFDTIIVTMDTLTHFDIIQTAARWLQRRHSVVETELATTGEQPDAIGWRGWHSRSRSCIPALVRRIGVAPACLFWSSPVTLLSPG